MAAYFSEILVRVDGYSRIQLRARHFVCARDAAFIITDRAFAVLVRPYAREPVQCHVLVVWLWFSFVP